MLKKSLLASALHTLYSVRKSELSIASRVKPLIREMEKRTLKKWSVAEKQDYGRLKGQIEACAGNKTEVKWKQFCAR